MIHRKWVRYYCFQCGLYWQGLTHDFSKYSPVEFFESAKYYQGTLSPIDACKKDKGYSMAWLHHRGRNKHHWEYWIDNFDKGMTPLLIPMKYAIEMFCDFLGAGKAYMGNNYTAYKEFAWWQGKRITIILHPAIRKFLDLCFEDYLKYGIHYIMDEQAHAVKSNYIKAVAEYQK